MRVLTASVTAFAAAALLAASGTVAFACDFHSMQVTAQVQTPASAQEQAVEATKIDPRHLAYLSGLAVGSADAADAAETD